MGDNLANVKIPKLKGTKNFMQWLATIETVAVVRGWDDQTTRIQMLAAIDAEIMNEITDIRWNGDDATAVNVIKDTLREQYMGNFREEARRNLEERKLKFDETIEEYGREIVRLARTANPAIPYDDLSFYFVRGLPQSFQKEVKPLRLMANDIHRLIGMSAEVCERSKPSKKGKPVVSKNKNFKSKKDITCYKCNKKGHYAKDCFSRREPPSRTLRARDVTYLVDTGSDRSFLSKKLVQQNNFQVNKCESFIEGFEGSITKIGESVQIPSGTLLVHEKEFEDLIIGKDLIEKFEEGKDALLNLEKIGKKIASEIIPEKCFIIGTKLGPKVGEKSSKSPVNFEELISRKGNLDENQKERLCAVLEKYSDLFDDSPYSYKRMEDTYHEITLSSDKPVKKIPYRIPFSLQDTLKETISELI